MVIDCEIWESAFSSTFNTSSRGVLHDSLASRRKTGLGAAALNAQRADRPPFAALPASVQLDACPL